MPLTFAVRFTSVAAAMIQLIVFAISQRIFTALSHATPLATLRTWIVRQRPFP
jgi:hypothetical protein